MKRKLCLAAIFAGVALAAGGQEKPRPDPETAKILASVNMTYADATDAAGGKIVSVYYDEDNPAGEAFASSVKDGKYCTISWSYDGEGLSSGFLKAEAQAIGLTYDKSIDHDIEKISMLHELSHCTQVPGEKINEYDADENALTRYLAGGGSRDTAQYWVYWRGVSGLLHEKRYTSHDNYTPGVGLRLQAKFFGGDVPDLAKIRAAYDEVMPQMKGLATAQRKDRVRAMLADDKLSPGAHRLLQFYDDAFRYLAAKPALKKLPGLQR